MAAHATTHVAAGNIDEACRIGAAALDMAVQMKVEPNRQDIVELRE